MEGLTIAVAGATGEVGRKMIEILQEREFPVERLRVFASARSAGERLSWQGESVVVENLDTADISDIDIALSALEAPQARLWAPRFVEHGAVVIDNSSGWRMDEAVPLVVAEVNPDDLQVMPKGIIANPNCTTMLAMPVIKPLHNAAGLIALAADTKQSASGAGSAGISELRQQISSAEGIPTEYVPHHFDTIEDVAVFPDPIAYNVIPLRGELDKSGETSEELKLKYETRKILGLGSLAVSADCNSVPTLIGHAVTLRPRFRRELSPQEATDILADAPGIIYSEIPTVLEAAGRDRILYGRVRRDTSVDNGLVINIAGDNLRKGAALNAVQLAEAVVERGLLLSA